VKLKRKESPWLEAIHTDIVDYAVMTLFNVMNSLKAADEERKHGGKKTKSTSFLKEKSIKNSQITIGFSKRMLKSKRKGKAFTHKLFIQRLLEKSKLKKMPEEVEAEFKLTMCTDGSVYIHVPSKREVIVDEAPPHDSNSTVALDPGLRTFQTCFDADGRVIHCGVDDHKHLEFLLKKCDEIKANIALKKKKNAKKKNGKRGNRSTWNLRRALRRYRKIIKNKVSEAHRKLAVFLCKNYRCILIGEISVSKILNNIENDRNIRNSTARLLQQWSHYKFRQVLKEKAELYSWCQVIEVPEEYTSKTCGCCGNVDSNLGGSKVYECKKCGFTIDRDVNGARNILLKFLSEYCKLLDD
jgi:IS605 OrfB family transposase